MNLTKTSHLKVIKRGLLILALLTSSAIWASAQDESPRAEIKATVGGAGFIDAESHVLVGGAVRVYVTKRFSVEPEFLYLRNGNADQDYLFNLNVAYDITDPSKRGVFYAVGGGGVLNHRSKSFFNSSRTGGSLNGGVGVKIFLTKRLFIAPEIRAGIEPILRGTVSVGYVFASRK